MTRGTERAALAAILALSLLLRLIHFQALTETAYLELPRVFTESDMHTFWNWAGTIVDGDWLGRDTYHPYFAWMREIAPLDTWYRWWGGKEVFHQSPLYPYWIAAILAASGKSLATVILVQLLIGSLGPLLLYWLGTRLFEARVGLAAALIAAVYGPFIFYQGTLLRDWMYPLLNTLLLLTLLKARSEDRAPLWLLSGLTLGLSYLAKTTILLFVPLALLWVRLGPGMTWRRTAAAWCCLGLGGLLTLAPVIVRNVAVGAPPLAVSTRLSEGFIIGNAADGDPVTLVIPPSMPGILARTEGRLWPVIRETLGTFHGEVARFLAYQFHTLKGIVNAREMPNNIDFQYGREISPVLGWTLGFGTVFALGLAGALIRLPAWRQALLLYLFLIAVLGGLWLQPVRSRYRLDLVTALILFGGAFLVWLGEAVRTRAVARVIAGAGLALALAVSQHTWLALSEARYYLNPAEYFWSADIYATQGRFDRAIAELDRFRARDAAEFPLNEAAKEYAARCEGDYRLLWAQRLLKEGHIEPARRQVEQAEAAYASQFHLGYPLYNLSLFYVRLGDIEKARSLLSKLVEQNLDGDWTDKARTLLSRLDDDPADPQPR